MAAVTGTGGGSVRDVLLGATPVFWVEKPVYLLICAAVAILTFFTAHLVESRYKLLLWLDAAGLAAYSVMGAAKGLAISGSMTVAIVTGMLTATFGGVLRDILAGEPSVLMRPEIYVTAAGIGAAAFVAADAFGLPLLAASAIGVLAAFLVRGGALAFGWSISPYRPRPGRNPDDIV